MSQPTVPPSGDPPTGRPRLTRHAWVLLVSSAVTTTFGTTYTTTYLVTGSVPEYWHTSVVGSTLVTLALLVALLRRVAREERSRRGPA